MNHPKQQVSEAVSYNPYGFTGERHDTALGLVHLRTRDYQFEVGRFVKPDIFPGFLTQPLTLNKYGYVSNDPINLVDPLGLVGERTIVGSSSRYLALDDEVENLALAFPERAFDDSTLEENLRKSKAFYGTLSAIVDVIYIVTGGNPVPRFIGGGIDIIETQIVTHQYREGHISQAEHREGMSMIGIGVLGGWRGAVASLFVQLLSMLSTDYAGGARPDLRNPSVGD